MNKNTFGSLRLDVIFLQMRRDYQERHQPSYVTPHRQVL